MMLSREINPCKHVFFFSITFVSLCMDMLTMCFNIALSSSKPKNNYHTCFQALESFVRDIRFLDLKLDGGDFIEPN